MRLRALATRTHSMPLEMEIARAARAVVALGLLATSSALAPWTRFAVERAAANDVRWVAGDAAIAAPAYARPSGDKGVSSWLCSLRRGDDASGPAHRYWRWLAAADAPNLALPDVDARTAARLADAADAVGAAASAREYRRPGVNPAGSGAAAAADSPWRRSRGAAAAATRIVRGDGVAAPPRPRRG